MLDVAKELLASSPWLRRQAAPLRRFLLMAVSRVVHEKTVNEFVAANGHLGAVEFTEKVLELFAVRYEVSGCDRENIPAHGPVLIVANHPLGALDALALVKLISEVRRDIRVVASGFLARLNPLRPILLPVDNFGGKTPRRDIENVIAALTAGHAVIIFPAGEVARASWNGIRDSRWNKGFLMMAKRAQAPLLPVHIDARNPLLFYLASMLHRTLGTLLLVHAMFARRKMTLRFRIGGLIPYRFLAMPGIQAKTQVKLLHKHLERIGRGRRGIYNSVKSIAHPEDRRALRQELRHARLLGMTMDGKRILLFDAFPDSAVMREIGRLREVAFRAVDEGSGTRRDLDRFDSYYRHIIVWDDEDLEIAGAYRLGEGEKIMQAHGVSGFYTATLFDFSADFIGRLPQAVELGRSFVQPKYWGTRALDYLWQGIGAYLSSHPQVHYLFGPVSISGMLPEAAKALLVTYYRRYFGGAILGVRARCTYHAPEESPWSSEKLFAGLGKDEALQLLKERLRSMDVAIPTLYKQYTELCEEGGTTFLDFGVDRDFENCIDGFMLVDSRLMKAHKRKRYVERFQVSDIKSQASVRRYG